MNKFAISCLLLISCYSCTKYLDAKPNDALSTPSTLRDLQLMLDLYEGINNGYPVNSEIFSDNYYLTTADWKARNVLEQGLHTWSKVQIESDVNWAYTPIFMYNTVLDALPKVESNDVAARNNIEGTALFMRAYYYFGIATLYAAAYNETSEYKNLGLVIRASSNFSDPSIRYSVKETYDMIVRDLKRAATLLPQTAIVKSRPCKPAAYGALAKVYLSMREYEAAGKYADSSLLLYDSLMNFNPPEIVATQALPFKRFNKEVLFQMRSAAAPMIAPTRAKMDSNLVRSYHANDMRKTAYYRENTGVNKGTFAFKGDYDGSGSSTAFAFTGIVTDEMFLIRAEAHARAGRVGPAMDDLNKLLITRWKTSTFVPFTANTQEEALDIILAERRKELVFRGTRWLDLKRLQFETRYAVTPKRVLDGVTYEVQPGSPRFMMQIPTDVIRLGEIQQNP